MTAEDRCKTAATAAKDSVLLRCTDLAWFQVPASLALRSGRVATAVGAGERVVDLPRNVSGRGVATVITYWEERATAAARGADLGEFDGEFVRRLSHDAAIDLISAAARDYLDDKGLFNLFLA